MEKISDKTRKQLETLVGKKIYFNKQMMKFESFKEVNDNICIATSARIFQFYPFEVEEQFLNIISYEKKDGTLAHPADITGALITLPAENSTIKDTLLEVIKKIKEDPGFLPQAKGVCEAINTMVNVQKTEIEMIKLQKDI